MCRFSLIVSCNRLVIWIAVSLLIIGTGAYVGYELFPGFPKPNDDNTTTTINNMTNDPSVSDSLMKYEEEKNNMFKIIFKDLNETENFINNMENNYTKELSELQCQEEESPENIGAYEVPTEKDLIILFRESLKHKLSAYNGEVLHFLRDIKDITKSLLNYESECKNKTENRHLLKKCVRDISNHYVQAAKTQTAKAVQQMQAFEPLLKGEVCKTEDLKSSPLEMLKKLAVERTELEFALPGLLKLIHKCLNFCM